MTEPEFDPANFPSLSLAYERARESAAYQAGVGDDLDGKLALLWSAATAVAGVVIPLVFARSGPGWAIGFAIGFYLAATLWAALGYLPRRFGGYDDISKLQEVARVEPARFMVDSITYIGQQVAHDECVLKRKALAVLVAAGFTLLEVAALLAWVVTA